MEGTVGTREGIPRYGTGWRTRLVHGRGFRGTERGEGSGWYTTMHSGVRNVWNEGFVHKMKPERTPHAVGETGVWRKGEEESVKSDRDDGSVLSRAEDGGADADYGGTVTDG